MREARTRKIYKNNNWRLWLVSHEFTIIFFLSFLFCFYEYKVQKKVSVFEKFLNVMHVSLVFYQHEEKFVYFFVNIIIIMRYIHISNLCFVCFSLVCHYSNHFIIITIYAYEGEKMERRKESLIINIIVTYAA